MSAGEAPRAGRPNLPPGSVRPPTRAQRGGRWWLARPAGFALVLMCFALPFLATSCSTPGGYGQVAQGGSESYTGYDLAFGLVPTRTAELLPAEQWRSDALGWQPLLILGLLCVVAGLVLPLVIQRSPVREQASAVVAGLSLLSTVVGVIMAKEALADQISRNARSRGLQLERDAVDYVVRGQGVVLAVVVLLAILVTEVSLLRARQRTARPGSGAAEPAPRLPPTAAPGWTSEPSSPPTPPGGGQSPPGPGPLPARTLGEPWQTGTGDPGPAATGASPWSREGTTGPPRAEGPTGLPRPAEPAGPTPTDEPSGLPPRISRPAPDAQPDST